MGIFGNQFADKLSGEWVGGDRAACGITFFYRVNGASVCPVVYALSFSGK